MTPADLDELKRLEREQSAANERCTENMPAAIAATQLFHDKLHENSAALISEASYAAKARSVVEACIAWAGSEREGGSDRNVSFDEFPHSLLFDRLMALGLIDQDGNRIGGEGA